jgi:regulation of enolase protein 1 (concanavalin A-like superfamily)
MPLPTRALRAPTPRPSRRSYRRYTRTALLEPFEPRLLLSALPSSLHETDIGSVGFAGSSDYNTTADSYALTGSGSWIWYSNDNLHYVYKQIIGDGSVTVRVADPGAGNPSWVSPKSGLMIRQNLASNAAEASLFTNPTGNVSFQYRDQGAWSTSSTAGSTYSTPVYLKITKSGDTLTAASSSDGATWTTVASQTLHFAGAFYVGMAVDSENNYTTNTATFDHFSTTGTSPTALPNGWSDTDVGNTGTPGSASYDNGTITFSVNGGGAEIYDTSDQFNYAYQQLTGDGSIIAHVADAATTNSVWALGGIMIRNGLSASDPHASMILAKNGTTEFLARTSASATTATTYGASGNWLKLTRAGNLFTGYTSTDGTTWTQTASATLSMSGPVYIGLVANSGNSGDGQTVAFDNVTVVGAASQAPATPTNLTLDFPDSSYARLSWDPAPTNSGVTGYNLYMSTNNGPFSLITTLTDPAATSYSITGLAPNANYTFHLSAFNASSAESAPATATANSGEGIAAPVITSVASGSLMQNGTESMTLAWSKSISAGVQKAYVELSEIDPNSAAAENWFTIMDVANPNSATGATIANLPIGGTFKVRIRLITSNWSAYSAATQPIQLRTWDDDFTIDPRSVATTVHPTYANVTWTNNDPDSPTDHYILTQASGTSFPSRWYATQEFGTSGLDIGTGGPSYGWLASTGSGVVTNQADATTAFIYNGNQPTAGSAPTATLTVHHDPVANQDSDVLSWVGNSTNYEVLDLNNSFAEDLLQNISSLDVTDATDGSGGHTMDRVGYLSVVGYDPTSGLYTKPSSIVDVSKAFAPMFLQATATSLTSVKLEWDNTSYNENGFQIDRSTDGIHFTPLKTIDSPDITEYTDTTIFPNVSYTYHVRATRANSTLASSDATATVASSLSVASLSAIMNGSTKTSTDTALTISASNIVSAIRNTGQSISLIANGLNPSTTEAKNLLKWTVVENVEDGFQGGAPTITPDASDPTHASVTLNSTGSFNVIVYADKDGNGTFDLGEQLRVLHLAIVEIDLKFDSSSGATSFGIGTPPSQFNAPAGALWASATPWPSTIISFSATVDVIGGGYDGKLGTAGVDVGFLGNLISDTRRITYSDGHTLVAGFTHDRPLLDAQGTGGIGTAAFRGSSTEAWTEQEGTILLGWNVNINAYDIPGMLFYSQLNFGAGNADAESIDGTVTFKDYLTGVTFDFPNVYTSIRTYDWAFNASFATPHGGNLSDAQSSATLSESPTPDGVTPAKTSGPTVAQSVPVSNSIYWN